MRVTAVVPALDEAPTVGAVVRTCLPLVDEVLVVDGGSRDATCTVAAAAGARVIRLGQRGKGLAIQRALREDLGELVVFIDADGSHRPADIPRLLAPLRAGQADLVIASRETGGSDELDAQPDHRWRSLGTRLIQRWVNSALEVELSDIQNGFRAARTEVIRDLPLSARGFCIEQEMALLSLRLGYRVSNVPSHEDRRQFGRSRLCLWREAPRLLGNAASLTRCARTVGWGLAWALLLLAAAVFGGVYVWARDWGPADAIGDGLERLLPAAFALSAVLAIGAAAAARRDVGRLVRRFTATQRSCLAALLLATSLWRAAAIPAGERLYYDELSYLQVAQAIAANGRAEVAAVGFVGPRGLDCYLGSHAHFAVGWPTLVAASRWLGRDVRRRAFRLDLLLSLATIVLLALLVAAVGGAPRGLAAAALLALAPAHQVWSRAAASEVGGAAALALAALAAVAFARRPSAARGWLLAAALALAAQMRNELVLVLPWCALLAAQPTGAKGSRLWPFTLALLLLAPQAAHLGLASSGYQAGVAGAGFAWRHLPANAGSLLSYLAHEPLTLLLLLAALAGGCRVPWRAAWGLGALLLAIVPLGHFGGSYGYPGGDRFALSWTVPLAALAGLGAGGDLLTRAWSRPAGRLAALVAASLAAGWSLPYAAARDRLTAVPRADCAFLRAALASVEPRSVVLTTDPAAVLTAGVSAVYIPTLSDLGQPLAWLAGRCPGGIYWYQGPSSAPADYPEARPWIAWLDRAGGATAVARSETSDGLRVLYRLHPRPGSEP
jgi:dolichol-phosphate mannosyltransferase